uniref:GPI-anchored protein pfl2 n=1 Tax=Crassostrea virginica TaxID=6565 RepID=A0A8B8D0H3_CRAVI|nr:putative GPI-anchored protein pfl2 [Crassostrea virginica]
MHCVHISVVVCVCIFTLSIPSSSSSTTSTTATATTTAESTSSISISTSSASISTTTGESSTSEAVTTTSNEVATVNSTDVTSLETTSTEELTDDPTTTEIDTTTGASETQTTTEQSTTTEALTTSDETTTTGVTMSSVNVTTATNAGTPTTIDTSTSASATTGSESITGISVSTENGSNSPETTTEQSTATTPTTLGTTTTTEPLTTTEESTETTLETSTTNGTTLTEPPYQTSSEADSTTQNHTNTSENPTTIETTSVTSYSPTVSSTVSSTLPTTAHPNINKEFDVTPSENALLVVLMNVTFSSCPSSITDALLNISNALRNISFFVSVSVGEHAECQNNSATSRLLLENSGKKIELKVSVKAQQFVQEENPFSNINSTITESMPGVVVSGFSSPSICDSDECLDEMIKSKGFQCKPLNDTVCNFTSLCTGHSCGEFGHCTLEANGQNTYVRNCKCNEDDMYQYTLSEQKCVRGEFSFKTWMIIAAGAGGLIILILLFVVVVLCAKRKGEATSNVDRYVYDVGDNDRETLMYSKSYDQIQDQFHRKPSYNDMTLDSRTQTSLQTFDNHGYDHWDPMESRETYASMDRHFQSPDFQPQITRPS